MYISAIPGPISESNMSPPPTCSESLHNNTGFQHGANLQIPASLHPDNSLQSSIQQPQTYPPNIYYNSNALQPQLTGNFSQFSHQLLPNNTVIYEPAPNNIPIKIQTSQDDYNNVFQQFQTIFTNGYYSSKAPQSQPTEDFPQGSNNESLSSYNSIIHGPVSGYSNGNAFQASSTNNLYNNNVFQPQSMGDFSQDDNYHSLVSYNTLIDEPGSKKPAEEFPQGNNSLRSLSSYDTAFQPAPGNLSLKKQPSQNPSSRRKSLEGNSFHISSSCNITIGDRLMEPAPKNPGRAKHDQKYMREINDLIVSIASKFDRSIKNGHDFNKRSKKKLLKFASSEIDKFQDIIKKCKECQAKYRKHEEKSERNDDNFQSIP